MMITLFPELSKVAYLLQVLPHVVAKGEVNCLVPFCDNVVS
jgi:hypothetical protein